MPLITILEGGEQQELEPDVVEHIQAVSTQLGHILAYEMRLAYDLFNVSSRDGLKIVLHKIFRHVAQIYHEGTKIQGKRQVRVKVGKDSRGKNKYLYLMPIGRKRIQAIYNAISESNFREIARAFTVFTAVSLAAEECGFEEEGEDNGETTE